MYSPYDKPLDFIFPSGHELKGKQSLVLDPFQALSKMNGHNIHEAFENSNCSDCIVLTEDSIEQLREFHSRMRLTDKIPNDIVIQNTIPITDLTYKLDSTETHVESYFRIVNYDKHLYMQVTLVNNTVNNYYFNINYDDDYFSLYVDTRIVFVDQCELSYNRERLDTGPWYKLGAEITKSANIMLLIWYTTQILLLNPEIKKVDMLKKGKKEKIPVRHISHENAKRKTKYIKTLYLNNELFDAHKEFQRHTLCWYVIGHYRKHGKGKVWVNGYWKGPMRHAKKNLDKGRERAI